MRLSDRHWAKPAKAETTASPVVASVIPPPPPPPPPEVGPARPGFSLSVKTPDGSRTLPFERESGRLPIYVSKTQTIFASYQIEGGNLSVVLGADPWLRYKAPDWPGVVSTKQSQPLPLKPSEPLILDLTLKDLSELRVTLKLLRD